jgi:hypothetical protein
MHTRHTQERADIGAVTSRALVNSGCSKAVNTASTNMMKKFLLRVLHSKGAAAVSVALQPRTAALNHGMKKWPGKIPAIRRRG